jgi:dolichyl-phosphate beta-glucosyltransferase
MNKVLFIIPCFNEEQRFPIEYWRNLIKDKNFYFLFIDDGSRDKTVDILTSLKSQNSEVISLPQNLGKSNALRSGILEAYKNDYRNVLIVDSDGSFTIKCIYDFISRFEFEIRHNPESYQAFFGARVKLAGRSIKRNLSRHIYSRILHTILGFMNKKIPYDSNCGLKMLCLGIISSEIFNEPFKSRWFFEIELLQRHKLMSFSDMKIFDIPVLDTVDIPTQNFRIKNRYSIIKELLWILK